MVVILIRWYIKDGFEGKFIEMWTNTMKVPKEKGLYREILTTADTEEEDLKYHTFSLESPYFKTYINIGIWRSMADFKELIESKYIPKEEPGEEKRMVELKDFEFKMRERIILNVITDRGGMLPEAAMLE